MVCLSNHFAGLAGGGGMSIVIITSFIIVLCIIMKKRQASKWNKLIVPVLLIVGYSVHHGCVVVMYCLFIYCKKL